MARNAPIFSKQKMSRRALLTVVGGAGAAALIGGGATMLASPGGVAAGSRGDVTLYKDPQCSCCEGYADYLTSNGFKVAVVPTHDLPLLDAKYGIPNDQQPCHLSLIGGYAVGGHIPIEVVNRLLAEKPQIAGINLPGMPTGVPGMPGNKSGPLTIYEIGKGPPKVYAVV